VSQGGDYLGGGNSSNTEKDLKKSKLENPQKGDNQCGKEVYYNTTTEQKYSRKEGVGRKYYGRQEIRTAVGRRM